MDLNYNRLAYLLLQRMLPYTKSSSEQELLWYCVRDYYFSSANLLHYSAKLLDAPFYLRSFPIVSLDSIGGTIKPGPFVELYKDDECIKTNMYDWFTRGFQITIFGKWLTKAIPNSTRIDPKIILGYVLAEAFRLNLDDFPFNAVGSIYHISYPHPEDIERILGTSIQNWRCMKTDFIFSATKFQLVKNPELVVPDVKVSNDSSFDTNRLARQITGSLFEDR